MLRTIFKALTVVAVIGALGASQAQAGWRHHHGCCGSSGGSWGSSGGCWGSSGGSWGSSGGSWGSSGGSWGSSGGRWGSSGGSWGSSGGSWGSSGGYGSTGGAYKVITPGAPATSAPGPAPTTPPANAPAPSEPAPAEAGATPTAYHPTYGPLRTSAVLTVKVPADAKVFVNEHPTTSTGVEREYISRDLQAGAHYNYSVRVEFLRDGNTVSETKTVLLTAGQTANLDFTQADQSVKSADGARTTLIVRLPAEARLYLAGRETKATGSVREFSTTKLAAGAQWTTYAIRAMVERDGQQQVREETVSLKAGESREVSIDFDSQAVDQVASRSAR
jgi:uncharacterized protein (TIGR03000 family)